MMLAYVDVCSLILLIIKLNPMSYEYQRADTRKRVQSQDENRDGCRGRDLEKLIKSILPVLVTKILEVIIVIAVCILAVIPVLFPKHVGHIPLFVQPALLDPTHAAHVRELLLVGCMLVRLCIRVLQRVIHNPLALRSTFNCFRMQAGFEVDLHRTTKSRAPRWEQRSVDIIFRALAC